MANGYKLGKGHKGRDDIGTLIIKTYRGMPSQASRFYPNSELCQEHERSNIGGQSTLRSVVRFNNIFHDLEQPMEASPGLLDNRTPNIRSSLSTSRCHRHHRQSAANLNSRFPPTDIARSQYRLIVTPRKRSGAGRGKIGLEHTQRRPSIQGIGRT